MGVVVQNRAEAVGELRDIVLQKFRGVPHLIADILFSLLIDWVKAGEIGTVPVITVRHLAMRITKWIAEDAERPENQRGKGKRQYAAINPPESREIYQALAAIGRKAQVSADFTLRDSHTSVGLSIVPVGKLLGSESPEFPLPENEFGLTLYPPKPGPAAEGQGEPVASDSEKTSVDSLDLSLTTTYLVAEEHGEHALAADLKEVASKHGRRLSLMRVFVMGFAGLIAASAVKAFLEHRAQQLSDPEITPRVTVSCFPRPRVTLVWPSTHPFTLDVYRDGKAIGSTRSATFTDKAPSPGLHTYTIHAPWSGLILKDWKKVIHVDTRCGDVTGGGQMTVVSAASQPNILHNPVLASFSCTVSTRCIDGHPYLRLSWPQAGLLPPPYYLLANDRKIAETSATAGDDVVFLLLMTSQTVQLGTVKLALPDYKRTRLFATLGTDVSAPEPCDCTQPPPMPPITVAVRSLGDGTPSAPISDAEVSIMNNGYRAIVVVMLLNPDIGEAPYLIAEVPPRSAMTNRVTELFDQQPFGGDNVIQIVAQICGYEDFTKEIHFMVSRGAARPELIPPPAAYLSPLPAGAAILPRSGTTATTFRVRTELKDASVRGYRWFFGDCAALAESQALDVIRRADCYTPLSVIPKATHRYARPGDYLIRLETHYKGGRLSTRTFGSVHVTAAPAR